MTVYVLVGFDDKGKGNHSVYSTFTTLVFHGKSLEILGFCWGSLCPFYLNRTGCLSRGNIHRHGLLVDICTRHLIYSQPWVWLEVKEA